MAVDVERLGVLAAEMPDETCECDCACPGDTNDDGVVNVLDLVQVVLNWGANDPATDFSGDGVTDVLDLLTVILAWGPCGLG